MSICMLCMCVLYVHMCACWIDNTIVRMKNDFISTRWQLDGFLCVCVYVCLQCKLCMRALVFICIVATLTLFYAQKHTQTHCFHFPKNWNETILTFEFFVLNIPHACTHACTQTHYTYMKWWLENLSLYFGEWKRDKVKKKRTNTYTERHSAMICMCIGAVSNYCVRQYIRDRTKM